MAEFFKWANANPAASTLVIFALFLFVIAFALLVIIFVLAFIKDRPIRFWVFELLETRIIYETGQIALDRNKNRELYDKEYIYKGIRFQVVTQRFTKTFKGTPDLVIGLTKLDAGEGVDGIVRIETFVKNVTGVGFDLHFETWDDSRLYAAEVSWIAIGR
jgi:hypothetical protein